MPNYLISFVMPPRSYVGCMELHSNIPWEVGHTEIFCAYIVAASPYPDAHYAECTITSVFPIANSTGIPLEISLPPRYAWFNNDGHWQRRDIGKEESQ